MYRFLSIHIWLLSWSFCIAQLPPGQYTSTNKRAIKFLEEGKSAFEQKNDAKAEKSFLKALEVDRNFIESAIGLANLYQVTGRHSEAIVFFKRAIDINPKFYPYSYYFLSLSLLTTGQYADAKTSLERFLKFDRLNPNVK